MTHISINNQQNQHSVCYAGFIIIKSFAKKAKISLLFFVNYGTINKMFPKRRGVIFLIKEVYK